MSAASGHDGWALVELGGISGLVCALDEGGPLGGQLWAWSEPDGLTLPPGRSWMGFVQRGQATLECASGRFLLQQGMYFSVPGPCALRGGQGVAIACPDGFEAMPQVGGPIERVGRLRYIDGCSDSLLVHPPRQGDPCLNLLHIPTATTQRAHTHPSLRMGVIARGRGRCQTLSGVYTLREGMAFAIPSGLVHSFHTHEDEALWVIAYHPDTDTGPRDEDHPMLNRTFEVPGGEP